MTDTVQLIEPSVPQQPDRSVTRRRRSFWRKCSLALGLFVLFLCISFATLCVLTGSFSNAMRLSGLGTQLGWDRVRGTPAFGGKQHVNILLIGADVSFDGSGEARTDTIKLISIDLSKSTIAMLSIPRDTWAKLPKGEEGRINGAYQLGGKGADKEANRVAAAKTAVQTLISDITGQDLPIDYYIRIQTGGFVKIIDALGGIDMAVEKQMDYEDPSQELFIHLKPGMQHLNGTQAMGYVRFRHDAEGDYGRIRRQDAFIRLLAMEMRKPEKQKRLATEGLGAMMDMVITDLTVNDALEIKRLVAKVGMDGIYSATLPTVPTTRGKAMVVEVEDRELATQTIHDVLDGARPTVAVLNGSARTGIAKTISEQIDAGAYNVIGVGTTGTPAPTSVVFSTLKFKQEATALAACLGVTTIDTKTTPPPAVFGKKTETIPTAQIIIVLGGDYRGNANLAQATTP